MVMIRNCLFYLLCILLVFLLFHGCYSMPPDPGYSVKQPVRGDNREDAGEKGDDSDNESLPGKQDKQVDNENAPSREPLGEFAKDYKEETEDTRITDSPGDTSESGVAGESGDSGEEGDNHRVATTPLSISEAVKKIKNTLKPPERPVLHNNSLIYCVHDFTADGIEEICFLGIESEESEKAGIEFLSNYSRIFSETREIFPFYLYIFSIAGGRLQLLRKIELGEHAVYKSMTKFSLYKGKTNPVVIAIHFYTQEGSMQKWLVFNAPGTRPLSQLQLLDSFSCNAVVEDINDDGWIDIVLFERGMEEGIGYETFITWKKWNKREFIDYKTTNIVRNLNSFLFHVKELGLSGDADKMISYSFDGDEVQKFRDKGLTDRQIIYTFFGLTSYFGTDDLLDFNILEGIHEIIFPEILDNPFYIRDHRGFYVKLSFRIMYTDGTSLIPEVLIYMLKNPFGGRQFVLFPVTLNGDGS
jgi:hypothetical protein